MEQPLQLASGPGLPVCQGRRVTAAGPRILVRAMPRPAGTECFLTARADPDPPSEGRTRGLFIAVARELAARGVRVLHEQIYGRREAKSQALAARCEAYSRVGLAAAPPPVFLEGAPLGGGGLAGLQIWGVMPEVGRGLCVESVRLPGGLTGRCWSGAGFRLLHLPGVTGRAGDGALASGRPDQAQRMFANAETALEAAGLRYTQVVRTWIYLARLLDWYVPFNDVRTRHCAARGIGTDGGAVFPASTGIQGRMADEECCMHALALEVQPDGDARSRPVQKTPRQPEAFAYGSSFSRGMAIEIDGRSTIHVSGTASIGPGGESLHSGDPEAQCFATLMSVAAVLAEEQAGLGDIASATVFVKNRETGAAFFRILERLGMPEIPLVAVRADVCRPELLVEMEAVAFAPPAAP